MSRDQIDRILKSDLYDIDQCISQKISSIDQFAEELTERSNFIVQFQNLLKEQLNGFKKQNQDEDEDRNSNYSFNPPFELSELMTYRCLDTKRQQESHNQSIEQAKKQELKDHLLYKQIQKNKTNFKELNNKLTQMRYFWEFTKNEILRQISNQRRKLIEDTKISFVNCFQAINNVYESKMSSLLFEIDDLKTKNQLLYAQNLSLASKQKNTKTPLLEINNSFNITRKLKPYDEKLSTEQTVFYNDNIQEILNKQNSQKKCQTLENNQNSWKSYQYFMNSNNNGQEHIKKPSKLKSNGQINGCYDLPYIQVLNIGRPPVRNGFGVLKLAGETIYRGNWKDGMFQGKGKLTFQIYTYEGEFKMGKFEGHGALKIGSMLFLGVFHNHVAQGEGTLTINGQQISGIWNVNKLQRML